MGQVLFGGDYDRQVFDISPGMVKSYRLDWARRLACNPVTPGDTITGSVFEPEVLTVVDDGFTATDTSVTVAAAAAIPGHTYPVLNRITTADNQTDEWPLYFRIRRSA